MGYDTRVGTIYRNGQGYVWLFNLKQLLHNFLSELVAYIIGLLLDCMEWVLYGIFC